MYLNTIWQLEITIIPKIFFQCHITISGMHIFIKLSSHDQRSLKVKSIFDLATILLHYSIFVTPVC